jgi:hypothetical protein
VPVVTEINQGVGFSKHAVNPSLGASHRHPCLWRVLKSLLPDQSPETVPSSDVAQQNFKVALFEGFG